MSTTENTTTARDRFQEAMLSLFDTVNSDLVEFMEENKTKEDLAGALQAIRAAVKLLGKADAVVEAELITLTKDTYGEQVIAGVGTMTLYNKNKKVRYDNKRVISVVGQRIAQEVNRPTEDGEILSRDEAVNAAIQRMALMTACDTMSYNSWRKGEAKKLGLDLEVWKSEEGGQLAVRFIDA